MKKTGIIVLSLFMVLLSGCGSTAQETPKNDTPSTVSDYDITVTMVEGTEKLSMASHKVSEHSKQMEKTGLHICMKVISLMEPITAME